MLFQLGHLFLWAWVAFVLTGSISWGETSLESAGLVLLAREPFSVQEIRDLAEVDDVFALETFDSALARRLEIRKSLESSIVPREIDEEIAEVLNGIEKLAPVRGAEKAREILEQLPSDSLPVVVAGGILARQGDTAVVREGLAHYFEQPNRWGVILGEAARSTDDPRLVDFLDHATPRQEPPSSRLLRSRLELNLALSEEASTISALLYWAADNGGLSAARILSWIPEVRPHDDWINYRLAALATPKQQTPGTWFHALDGLGRRKAGKHISLILKALQGDDPVASAVAARALARLGDREAVPEIRKKLVSLDEPFGPSAVAALVELGGADQAKQLAQEFEHWGFRASVPVLEALHEEDGDSARAAIRALQGISGRTGRLRAFRLLAERDSPAFNQLPLDDVDPYWVNLLHPFLARSRYRRTRDFVLSAAGEARGPAMAALLVSPTTTLDEKERAVQVLGDAWPDAIQVGGKAVVRELDRLSLREPSLAVYRDTERWPSKLDSPAMLDTLALLPGEQARLALERLGTVTAIERLMRREDRPYSISALGELRRIGGRAVQEAAERALLELGAPGVLAIMQRKLAQPTELGALAPVLAEGPLASEAFRYLAGEKGRHPDVMASLFAYHKRKPPEFLRLLSLTDPISIARLVASKLDSAEAARGVCARLP